MIIFRIKKKILSSAAFFLLSAALLAGIPESNLSAHHGVASLGVAGLKGPGAPVESAGSANLPAGSILGYWKADHADFLRYSPYDDDEVSTNTYMMWGSGYGLNSWLSGYVFLPYNVKLSEDNSWNTSGFADLTFLGALGFRYDGSLSLVPEGESLDDLEDWHFTLYGGLTAPTGNANLRDQYGDIDPGMSTGFGSSSYTTGFSAVKMIDRLTVINDVSLITFDPYRYRDGLRVRFGSEFRYNLAFSYRAWTDPEKKLRIDPVFEFNFVRIGMDREKGIRHRETMEAAAALEEIPVPADTFHRAFPDSVPPWRYNTAYDEAQGASAIPEFNPWGLYASTTGIALKASGGDILYVLPGFRIYKDNISIAAGVKIPAWTRLNRIPLSRNLGAAFLQESYKSESTEESVSDAVPDAWWEHGFHAERASQGSEGRERARFQISVSILM